jgi:hypothetical protein
MMTHRPTILMTRKELSFVVLKSKKQVKTQSVNQTRNPYDLDVVLVWPMSRVLDVQQLQN